VHEFSESVLTWFDGFGRKDLPWQENKNPYAIWISEIMLQQTQVATVIPYYLRFMESFPNLKALSMAPLESVLHHWSGLGYYARARNLHKTSILIEQVHDGVFPLEFDILLELPGIGRSTAGAILALSDSQRFAILDGNVKRVLARFHAVEGWPGKKKTENLLWGLAEGHLPSQKIASYTQAMMDLGATVCTRTKPKCIICPIQKSCVAHDHSSQEAYPTRKQPKAKPHRILPVIMLICKDKVVLEERPQKGIWGGLFSLPELKDESLLEAWCEERIGYLPKNISRGISLQHTFSHYSIEIKPIEVRVNVSFSTVKLRPNETWYALYEPAKFGLAAPIKKLLKDLY
jgi:A/G-specific adenine glycosylase